MADYFTQLALQIEMPGAHTEWCLAFHNACVDCLDDPDELAARRMTKDAPDYLDYVASIAESGQEYTGIGMTMHTGLWIESEESANVEYLAEFLSHYLRHFGIKDRTLAFEWSNTCSKMRPDGWGGGACVVGYDETRWINTTQWIEETQAAMNPNAESVRSCI